MRKREHRFKRKVKSLILVICEGQTERCYVEALKRLYRLPIEIKTKVSGANINSRIINGYRQELNLEKNDTCKIILMYDADVPAVVSKLEKLNELAILTNPCIELWFLLHVKNHHKECSSSEIIDALTASHPVWNRYEKGVLSQKQIFFLIDSLGSAIDRSRNLKKGNNPYTNMSEFIDILENEKNAEMTQKSSS